MPPMPRNMTNMTTMSQRSDPGPGVGAAIGMAIGAPVGSGYNSGRPSLDGSIDQRPGAPGRSSDPDALPHHPVPVRPGLMEGVASPSPQMQAAKPAPIRQYNSPPSGPANAATSNNPRASVDRRRPDPPVTHAQLDQLRQTVKVNPTDHQTHLKLAKKLIEAATVLADENGRADPKTRAKNRERYILDGHKHVKKLVSANYPDAMFYLADCYGQGRLGLQVDPKEAFSLYQAAAKLGHGP
ncbi:hypothetical protein LTS18_001928, partial [Coniosporium uncinatum]